MRQFRSDCHFTPRDLEQIVDVKSGSLPFLLPNDPARAIGAIMQKNAERLMRSTPGEIGSMTIDEHACPSEVSAASALLHVSLYRTNYTCVSEPPRARADW
jgi:hypothetical protein